MFFSSLNKKGNVGPTKEEANNYYKNTGVKVEIIENGIQKWRVPYTSTYLIEATGAQGLSTNIEYSGGKGALYKSKFFLKRNDVLYILVGQQGESPDSHWGGAGGGASFVAKKVRESKYKFAPDNAFVEPLLVASGGGGSYRGVRYHSNGEKGGWF